MEPVASPPGVDPQEEPFAHADKIPETKIESSTPPPEPGEENDWAFVQQRGIEESNKPKLSTATDVAEDFSSLAAAELPEHLFIQPRQQKNKPSLVVATGILVFTLLAAAQLAWVNKQQLLEHPQGRQIMQQFCDLAECELEQQKATDKITVLHRNLQPSINHQHALSFTLSFTNDADLTIGGDIDFTGSTFTNNDLF